MAAKKKSPAKRSSVSKSSKKEGPSIIIQFAVVFVMVAAMVLVAFAYKNYL